MQGSGTSGFGDLYSVKRRKKAEEELQFADRIAFSYLNAYTAIFGIFPSAVHGLV